MDKWKFTYWPFEFYILPRIAGPMLHARRDTMVCMVKWLCFMWGKEVPITDEEKLSMRIGFDPYIFRILDNERSIQSLFYEAWFDVFKSDCIRLGYDPILMGELLPEDYYGLWEEKLNPSMCAKDLVRNGVTN